jgi:hypothetical protein
MTMDESVFFKRWFTDYVESFYSPNKEDQKNIFLKEKHTFEVCKNMMQISGELRLSNKDLMLSEVIALFHDIGRLSEIVSLLITGFLERRHLLKKISFRTCPIRNRN